MQSEGSPHLAESLGVKTGQVVQEIGFDDDCANEVRTAFETASGGQLVDYEYEDVVDVALVWFRDGDEDLVDLLVDVIAPLTDDGQIWLLTPKPGRPGHVEPADIADAAPTAGLQVTKTLSAAKDWQATRLVTPKSSRK
jgi:hypothetical protein